MSTPVHALAVFDDGGGPALYVGGSFGSAGAVAAEHIARWDGSSWSAVGGGVNSDVHALAVFDDGNGPALYAGGYFSTAGGHQASNIAKWDGSGWSPLGSGVVSPPSSRPTCARWRCSTTGAARRCTRAAASRGRAAAPRMASRDGMARAGRPWAAGSDLPAASSMP